MNVVEGTMRRYCPSYNFESQILTPKQSIHNQTLTQLNTRYQHLLDLLATCTKESINGASTTKPPAVPTTSIPSLMPDQCLTAMNLTDSWRIYRPDSERGYNCDVKDMYRWGRPWFRFAGQYTKPILVIDLFAESEIYFPSRVIALI